MTTIEKMLKSHGIKTNTIDTSKGTLVMADNEDGTHTPFNPEEDFWKVYTYLGY